MYMQSETASQVLDWSNGIIRWIHVLAGIMWIGHLWFFNFVNSQLAKTYDADSKKKVLPELMPRALYWFRWGAAYTWVTGLLLLGIVYYMGGALLPQTPGMTTTLGVGAVTAIGLGTIVVAWVVYDLLWKNVFAKNEMAGVAVSWLAVVAIDFGLSRVMSGRAMIIHTGAMFGTIMAANVWMRIWPGQRKIIAGVKGTAAAPDPSVPAIAGLRSKHNTYMSVPLVLAMIGQHFTWLIGTSMAWIVFPVFVLIAWGVTKLVYNKSATAAPAAF
jgi:uncharacterized membrane protein